MKRLLMLAVLLLAGCEGIGASTGIPTPEYSTIEIKPAQIVPTDTPIPTPVPTPICDYPPVAPIPMGGKGTVSVHKTELGIQKCYMLWQLPRYDQATLRWTLKGETLNLQVVASDEWGPDKTSFALHKGQEVEMYPFTVNWLGDAPTLQYQSQVWKEN